MSFEANVRKAAPYVPGEQPNEPDMIKLNTNECPYPPAPGVARAMRGFACADLRLYPDPKTEELSAALAEYHQVEPEQVFVGVGSDDVLAMSFLTFFNTDKPIFFPDITYSFYEVWAGLFRVPYHKIALDESFHMHAEDYTAENGGIIFPNPNAPTGIEESLELIEDIVRNNPSVVVIVDEAYVDFGTKSALSLTAHYENLLVVQTFSKSRAMAGMRIGYAIGSEKLIRCLKDVKFSFNSYTMNRPALVCGVEAIKDDVYFKGIVEKIKTTRERVKKELADLGFTFPNSAGNFIFAAHPSFTAKKLWEDLRKEHIYVRYFEQPRIDSYLRITIGTDEEMNVLLLFLRQYCR